MLYSLPASDFHNITSGANSNYSATGGYDMVTGLGSPAANLLVPALAENADLTVGLSDSGMFQQGGSGNFNVTLSNTGTISTVGTVTVTDTLPVGLRPPPPTAAA